MERMLLDDESLDALADMWYEENTELFDDIPDWEEAPDARLQAMAMDAAIAEITRARETTTVTDEQGKIVTDEGIEIMNEPEQVAHAFYLYFAWLTAASEDAYFAWLDTLGTEEEEENEEDWEDAEDDTEDEYA